MVGTDVGLFGSHCLRQMSGPDQAVEKASYISQLMSTGNFHKYIYFGTQAQSPPFLIFKHWMRPLGPQERTWDTYHMDRKDTTTWGVRTSCV